MCPKLQLRGPSSLDEGMMNSEYEQEIYSLLRPGLLRFGVQRCGMDGLLSWPLRAHLLGVAYTFCTRPEAYSSHGIASRLKQPHDAVIWNGACGKESVTGCREAFRVLDAVQLL